MSILEEHRHKKPVHEFDGIVENRVNPPPAYFTVLFYGLIIWGVIFSAYFLLSGWSSHEEFREKMAAHQQQAQAAGPAAPAEAAREDGLALDEGKRLFAQHCAACHGSEGKGGIGPDLTADTLKFGKEFETLTESIAKGRPGGMPGFGTQLSADQIAGIARFVRSL